MKELNSPMPKTQKVNELRVQRGWSQEQLSEIAGISLKTVQRMEQGSSVSLETIQAIAAAFDITPDILLFSSSNKKKDNDPKEQPKIEHLPRLRSGAEMTSFFAGACTLQFSHLEPRSTEEMEKIAELSQLVHDYMDIWSDIEPSDRVKYSFELTKTIEVFYASGLAIFGRSKRMKYVFKEAGAVVMDAVLILIERADHPAIVKVSDDLEVLPVMIPQVPASFV